MGALCSRRDRSVPGATASDIVSETEPLVLAAKEERKEPSPTASDRISKEAKAGLLEETEPKERDEAHGEDDAAEQEEQDRQILDVEKCRKCWQEKAVSICRRCNKAKYCSQACQKGHWSVHKQFCGKDDRQLREMWGMLLLDSLKTDGSLTRLRQFVHHVGGSFWYSDEGWRILHSMVHLLPLLNKYPSKQSREVFRAIVKDAVDLGADVNAKCKTGDLPLHFACKAGSKEARLLVASLLGCPSIDFEAKNNDGQTAVDVCKSKEFRAFVEQCQSARLVKLQQMEDERIEAQRTLDEEKSKAKLAAKKEEIEEREIKLSNQPRRERCRQCWLPGRFVCRRCNKVKYCTAACQKANWAIHSKFCNKTNPELASLCDGTFSEAQDTKSCESLRTIIQHIGGDVRIDPMAGQWVMHNVAMVIKQLIEAGRFNKEMRADVEGLLQDAIDFDIDCNAQMRNGETGLHILCALEGNPDLHRAITYLVEHGVPAKVDLNIKTSSGLTAYDCCKKNGVTSEQVEYTITLEKSGDAKLGLNISTCDDNQHLLVESVHAESGLVAAWNTNNPDVQVMRGDIIVRVNECRGDSDAILKECQQSEHLELQIERSWKALVAAFERGGGLAPQLAAAVSAEAVAPPVAAVTEAEPDTPEPSDAAIAEEKVAPDSEDS